MLVINRSLASTSRPVPPRRITRRPRRTPGNHDNSRAKTRISGADTTQGLRNAIWTRRELPNQDRPSWPRPVFGSCWWATAEPRGAWWSEHATVAPQVGGTSHSCPPPQVGGTLHGYPPRGGWEPEVRLCLFYRRNNRSHFLKVGYLRVADIMYSTSIS